MPAENRRLIWAPAAKNDLRDIWRYFVGVASTEIADRLLRDIQRASERARQRPRTWRARDEIMPGLRSVLVHPYVIFYRCSEGTVEIARVLHQRRNLAALFPKRKS
jgi:toxin ParE1/3/4